MTAYMQLVDSVQLVRQQWRVRRAVEGAALVVATAVALLLLATWFDQVVHLGIFGRCVLAAGVWTGALAVGWHWLVRPLRTPHTIDYFAALIEQRTPALGNRLINALQLGRETSPTAPLLVDAIVQQGAMAADELEPGPVVADPALKRNSMLLAGAVVVCAVYLLAAGAAGATHLKRIVLPTADIAPFTWTQVAITEPDKSVRLLEGSTLIVRAKTAGRSVETASLIMAVDNGDTRSLRMQGDGDDGFVHSIASVDASVQLSVSAGDGRSASVSVTVDPRPRIASRRVTYQPPAYTALPPQTIDNFDGHMQALPGSRATLTIITNKDLEQLTLHAKVGAAAGSAGAAGAPGATSVALKQAGDARTWTGDLSMNTVGVYHVHMRDAQGYQVDDPTTYSIALLRDAPPAIALTHPGRDVQLAPEDAVTFGLVARDDLGLGPIALVGKINDAAEEHVIHTWPRSDGRPPRQVELNVTRTVAELNLKAGDRLQYYATAEDLNNVSPTGPGKARTRRYNLLIISPQAAQQVLDAQLEDYIRRLTELIKLQRRNRADTADLNPAAALVDRQSLIRRGALQLADLMEHNAFPAPSIIDELRQIANEPMAQVLSLLESYRDAANLDAGKATSAQSLPVQDRIIAALEGLLVRLNRNELVRRNLKKLQRDQPAEHERVASALEKLSKDLNDFLGDVKDIDEKYERMAKKRTEELTGEQLKDLADVDHRVDRWKQWAKDTVDEIAKLPDGFVKDSQLADDINAIFEEIEKQKRGATAEIATPLEEGVKALATETAEDLEIWMPHAGDSTKWVMEDPADGKFKVPEETLADNLQDMVGDLIEDIEEFDEEADDVTGAWGGNMQVGWDVADGPISSFDAKGKTGNQLPNASEMSGRSGAGRRGKSSGQMVGDTSKGMEGRPTPARVTNERYEKGNVDASKQLDPRGATGGGKKTGGGAAGLQGGTPPDFVKDMKRLEQMQKIMREKAQKVASDLDYAGRPASRIDHAVELMKSAEQDLRDLRYDDAARKRKEALGELRAAQSGIDQAVNISLQKARDLPPELRQQISAGAQQALPEGYEDLVGAYYKALSEAGSGSASAGEQDDR